MSASTRLVELRGEMRSGWVGKVRVWSGLFGLSLMRLKSKYRRYGMLAI